MCLLIQRCRSQRRSKKKSIFFRFSAPTCSCFLYVQICVQKEFIEKPAQDAPHRVFEAFPFPHEGFEFRLMPGVREESPGLEMNLRDLMQIFAMKQIDFPFFPLHKLKRLLKSLLFLLGEIHVVFVRQRLKYQRESRQFPRKITQSPAQSKVVSDAEENNVEARIDFFRSSLLRWLSKSRNTKRSLAASGINHGIVKINYFGLMAQVARCDMFWEIFALVSRELFLAPFSE